MPRPQVVTPVLQSVCRPGQTVDEKLLFSQTVGSLDVQPGQVRNLYYFGQSVARSTQPLNDGDIIEVTMHAGEWMDFELVNADTPLTRGPQSGELFEFFRANAFQPFRLMAKGQSILSSYSPRENPVRLRYTIHQGRVLFSYVLSDGAIGQVYQSEPHSSPLLVQVRLAGDGQFTDGLIKRPCQQTAATLHAPVQQQPVTSRPQLQRKLSWLDSLFAW